MTENRCDFDLILCNTIRFFERGGYWAKKKWGRLELVTEGDDLVLRVCTKKASGLKFEEEEKTLWNVRLDTIEHWLDKIGAVCTAEEIAYTILMEHPVNKVRFQTSYTHFITDEELIHIDRLLKDGIERYLETR